MKILLTSDWHTDAVNGVVTSMLALAHGLGQKGHEVRLLTLSHGGFSFTDGSIYCQASHSCGFIYPKARFALHLDQRLFDDIVAWKPDIVHSQCEFSTFPMARRIAAATGAKLVHTFHTDYEHYVGYCHVPAFLAKAAARAIFRRTARRCDALVAPSVKTASLLPAYGIMKDVHVIASGIQTGRFEERPSQAQRAWLRHSYGIGDDDFVLLYLGRIAAEKGLDRLIDDISPVKRQRLVLMIAGGGPWLDQLRLLVDRFRPEVRVILTGMVDPASTHDIYHLADAFVMPSTSETQGLCLIEALASSLPVICRRDKVLEGVIEDGLNGLVYDDGPSFVRSLCHLMDDSEDRLAMAARAGRTGMRYGEMAFAERMEALYLSLLGRKAADREVAV